MKLPLVPTAQVSSLDTSLRYTDILFGLVIREVFVRLKDFPNIPTDRLLHLLVAAILVIGSWIGYRRSANRSDYEVKFFNIPLFKFLTDQGMLVLYFKVATITAVSAAALAGTTTQLVTLVFVLYFVWDLLGVWMAQARRNGALIYSKIDKDKKEPTGTPLVVDWEGALITFIGLLIVLLLDCPKLRLTPTANFIALSAVLVLYRYAKEVKTTWRAARAA